MVDERFAGPEPAGWGRRGLGFFSLLGLSRGRLGADHLEDVLAGHVAADDLGLGRRASLEGLEVRERLDPGLVGRTIRGELVEALPRRRVRRVARRLAHPALERAVVRR